jgi:hypothetical protein
MGWKKSLFAAASWSRCQFLQAAVDRKGLRWNSVGGGCRSRHRRPSAFAKILLQMVGNAVKSREGGGCVGPDPRGMAGQIYVRVVVL